LPDHLDVLLRSVDVAKRVEPWIDHGDLARRIAGLNLDFFASRLTTVRRAGFGPVGTS
jgi:hypothetical protein